MGTVNGTGPSPTAGQSPEPPADPPSPPTPPATDRADPNKGIDTFERGLSTLGQLDGNPTTMTGLLQDVGNVALGTAQMGVGVVQFVVEGVKVLLEDDLPPVPNPGDGVDDYSAGKK